MITEVVTFPIPAGMSRDEVVALYEKSAPGWRANPDLIRKNYLYDGENSRGGGIYMWKTLEAAKQGHDATFCERITASFGSPPEFQYYETPIVIDNEHGG
jgi:hypothetical protein